MKRLDDGRLRITIDRVRQLPGERWERTDPVSFKDFDREELVGMQLSDKEFETIGEVVIAELVGQVTSSQGSNE